MQEAEQELNEVLDLEDNEDIAGLLDKKLKKFLEVVIKLI